MAVKAQKATAEPDLTVVQAAARAIILRAAQELLTKDLTAARELLKEDPAVVAREP